MVSSWLLQLRINADIIPIIDSYLFLYDPRIHTWDSLAIDGNLKGLKYLHRCGILGCMSYTLEYAKEQNHEKVIEWLEKTCAKECKLSFS
jgi:hypothetical protein